MRMILDYFAFWLFLIFGKTEIDAPKDQRVKSKENATEDSIAMT